MPWTYVSKKEEQESKKAAINYKEFIENSQHSDDISMCI